MDAHAIFAATSLDKRRWRRLHFTVPIRVTCVSGDRVIIESRGCQMNPGGIGFVAQADLAIGTRVDIEFTDYALTLRGEIRDCSGNVYGVRFLDATAEENQQLRRFREMLSSKLGPLDA